MSPDVIVLIEEARIDGGPARCGGVVLDGRELDNVQAVDVYSDAAGLGSLVRVSVTQEFFPRTVHTMTRDQWQRLKLARSLNITGKV